MGADTGWLKEFIREIPDFPKAGVSFKDFTPLLADPKAFRVTIDALVAELDPGGGVDKVIGVEARGFVVAAPIAKAVLQAALGTS